MDRYRVGVAPHIRWEENTQSVMRDVCIALLPSLLWGCYLFGWRALVITVLSVCFCVLTEAAFQKMLHHPITVSDGSATVSGLLLAMNLPVGVPLWMIPLGAVFAIGITKQLFGGLGKNFVNPVLSARAFLFISFPAYMTSFPRPDSDLSPFSISLSDRVLADAVSGATPLKELKNGVIPQMEWTDLLSGNYAGSIGEVSSLLLLAGFLYLLVRGVITWHIPVFYVGTVAVLCFLFPQAGSALEYTFFSVFSGGLILGAVFMATDYVTSPVTRWGKVVYGILCGGLTVLIRFFGGYPEGVSFAILMANLLVWYLDRLFRPAPYGSWKRRAVKGGDKK